MHDTKEFLDTLQDLSSHLAKIEEGIFKTLGCAVPEKSIISEVRNNIRTMEIAAVTSHFPRQISNRAKLKIYFDIRCQLTEVEKKIAGITGNDSAYEWEDMEKVEDLLHSQAVEMFEFYGAKSESIFNNLFFNAQ